MRISIYLLRVIAYQYLRDRVINIQIYLSKKFYNEKEIEKKQSSNNGKETRKKIFFKEKNPQNFIISKTNKK